MDDSLFNILKKVAENQGTPYRSVKLLNDTLIVVFKDGKILTKNDATKEDYQAVLDCKTTIEIKEKINVEHNTDVVVDSVTWKTHATGKRIKKID